MNEINRGRKTEDLEMILDRDIFIVVFNLNYFTHHLAVTTATAIRLVKEHNNTVVKVETSHADTVTFFLA